MTIHMLKTYVQKIWSEHIKTNKDSKNNFYGDFKLCLICTMTLCQADL